jgi:carbonic anhydrase
MGSARATATTPWTMKAQTKIILTVQIAGLAFVSTVLCGLGNSFGAGSAPVSADEALRRLMQGNARYISGHMIHADYQHARRLLAQSQKPFAVIVGCSDSRVGPEIVFDEGLGDIFVIRTAGEVVDAVALGSIEYAVEHLGSPLIVVLGHERCGAVSAAVAGGEAPGHIADIVKAIEPAVEQTKGQPGDPVENAVRAQAINVARQLQDSHPILAEAVQSGKLKIVAARYDLDTGKVELLPL